MSQLSPQTTALQSIIGLNEIISNLNILLSLGNLIDSDGTISSWDPNNNNAEWYILLSGIESIISSLVMKGFATYDNSTSTSTFIFEIVLNYWKTVSSKGKISIGSIDLHLLSPSSLDIIFGTPNPTKTDQSNRAQILNDTINNLQNLIACLQAIS